MEDLRLIKVPNMEKTKKNANIFLKRNFQHYLNLAGMHRNQLSSPQLSLAPSSASNGNGVEKQFINEAQDEIEIAEPARRAVSAIYKSMDNCTETMLKPYRSILIGTYVKELTVPEIARETSLAESTVNKKKPAALCEFAERLDYWKKVLDCEFLPDLRVYDD